MQGIFQACTCGEWCIPKPGLISDSLFCHLQIFTFVPLVYICVCTYFSVFKLGMFSFYYLVPKHTDAVSLLVNAS